MSSRLLPTKFHTRSAEMDRALGLLLNVLAQYPTLPSRSSCATIAPTFDRNQNMESMIRSRNGDKSRTERTKLVEAMIATNPELADILERNPELAGKVHLNAALARTLVHNPGFAYNPKLIYILQHDPLLANTFAKNRNKILDCAASFCLNPEFVRNFNNGAVLLARHEKLREALVRDPDFAQDLASALDEWLLLASAFAR